MTEKDTLLSDCKATYGEMFPYRNPDAMHVDDAALALGVLLRREIHLKKYPPGNAHGLDVPITAKRTPKPSHRE